MPVATFVKYVLKASATSRGSLIICLFTSSCIVSFCLPFLLKKGLTVLQNSFDGTLSVVHFSVK